MIQTFSSTIRRKEMDAVLTCMVDEKTGPGELNSKFIQALKEFSGCDGAVAFRSPSIALSYALKALDLPENTSVMMSALAPFWQYDAIQKLGYKPLVLDVEEQTGLVNAEIVQKGISNGGRLLILHETMGILPQIEEIISLGIPVIEDISHSFGAVLPEKTENSETEENSEKKAGKKLERQAGSFGIFSILGDWRWRRCFNGSSAPGMDCFKKIYRFCSADRYFARYKQRSCVYSAKGIQQK